MNSLMKDRWAYVAQYKERVDDYYKYQKEYWRIFYMNPTNPYLQKITLDSLQNVSAALTQLYDIMPEIAGGQFTYVKTTAEEKYCYNSCKSRRVNPRTDSRLLPIDDRESNRDSILTIRKRNDSFLHSSTATRETNA